MPLAEEKWVTFSYKGVDHWLALRFAIDPATGPGAPAVSYVRTGASE